VSRVDVRRLIADGLHGTLFKNRSSLQVIYTLEDRRGDGQSLASFQLGGESQQFALFGCEVGIHFA
jgi:hypothetical protein